MAKYIAQIVMVGAQVIGRAFTRALQQEVAASREAAKRAQASGGSASQARRDVVSGLSVHEAKQILNVDKLDRELVDKSYEHLFAANDKAKGGSFYLQSKVVRAKERLYEELGSAEPPDKKKPPAAE